MSEAAKAKGHAHQQSVANAATLFGSSGDDPFADLGAIDEQAEEAAGTPAAEESAATPTMPPSTILPEVNTSSLEVPTANGGQEGSLASSPSGLFASSSPSDLFSTSTSDDWLGSHNSQSQVAAEFSQGEEQGGQGYEAYGQNYQYDQYGPQDGEAQQQPGSVYGQADPYQQDPNNYDYQQHNQAGQYGEGQHYDGYSQDQQHPDYGQAQQAYDPYYSNTQAEQYPNFHQAQHGNPYDQQPGYDASAYETQYSSQMQAGHTSDPSQSQQNGPYDQQPVYEPAAYGQETYDGAAYDPYEERRQMPYDPAFQSAATEFDGQQPYDGEAYGQHQPDEFRAATHDPQATYALNPYEEPLQQTPSSDQTPPPFGEHEIGTGDQHNDVHAAEHAAATEGQAETAATMESGNEYFAQDQDQDANGYQYSAQGQEANGYQYTEDGNVDPYGAANGDAALYAGESEMQPPTGDHDQTPSGYEGYAPYNYGGQEDGSRGGEVGYEAQYAGSDARSPYDPAPTSKGGSGFQEQFAGESQSTYAPSMYSNYAPQQVDEGRGDETAHQVDEYPRWNSEGASERQQWGNQVESYAASEDLRGDAVQEQVLPQADYFGGFTHTQEPSTEAQSLYAPARRGAHDSQSSPLQERGVDVAEERKRAKIPLASFSIDGKLLTFFPTWSHEEAEDTYGSGGGGYGLGRSAAPTKVTMRPLRTLIPPTSYASSKNPLDFPGPALEAGSSQGSALSRATGSGAANAKSKKAALIKYLNDAASEMASGIGYLAAGKHAIEARRMQDRIVILHLLALLLEHDGNAINNAAFDNAVKEMLLAGGGAAESEQGTSTLTAREPEPSANADQKARFLHDIEALLMAGQRKEAVGVAREKKMWTHAVVIASGMDRTMWREVVADFMASEFEQESTSHQGLKVAYNLFSGQEAKTTFDLFRPKTALSVESASPGEGDSTAANPEWRKAVATILANRSNGDSATLTAIGDGLNQSGWIEAAHVCYLLSPLTSPMDGYDGPMSRLTLLGAQSPETNTSYVCDLDHILLTEAFEFALSLQPVAKGAEAYHGLAFLQPYRLLHAYLLAEMGDVKQAIRYCDSIMTLLKNGKMNRYYHPVLLQQLQELSHRLQGDDGKSAAWTKKKPTMDGVWGALEGRFTKFIAGEDEGEKVAQSASKAAAGSTVGPFSHYSAITPDATSGGVSRVQSQADFGSSQALSYATNTPNSRPSSAMDFGNHRAGISPLTHAFNPGSEQGYAEWPTADSSQRSSPRLPSSDAEMYSGPFTTHATNGAPWYGQERETEGGNMQERTPTDGTFYGYQPHGAMQDQFVSNVDEDLSSAMKNASLEPPSDVLGNAPTPGLSARSYDPPATRSYAPADQDDDDEDLGFGNKKTPSTPVQAAEGDTGGQGHQETTAKAAEGKEVKAAKAGELKPAPSWFGRLWRKDSSTDTVGEQKAKKAHLGEETSFYYDKELKRWVNKKAGDSGPAATTPPPPPRAQTASPSVMGTSMAMADSGPRRVSSDVRPPPSTMPSSARATPPPAVSENGGAEGEYGSSLSPARPPPVNRPRSKLADLSQPAALQPGQQAGPPSRPGTSTPDGGPPRSVSGSGAAKKKPISKRYVRVD